MLLSDPSVTKLVSLSSNLAQAAFFGLHVTILQLLPDIYHHWASCGRISEILFF